MPRTCNVKVEVNGQDVFFDIDVPDEYTDDNITVSILDRIGISWSEA